MERKNERAGKIDGDMQSRIAKPVWRGTLAASILLGLYFAVLSLVSGWEFAQSQFTSFWYFIVSLAIGFGVQVGLYVYLQNIIRNDQGSSKILGVTATTSTASMISCCTHYLANLLPILGITGIVTFVTQYQVELFGVGLLFNIGGIAYIRSKIARFKKSYE